MIFRWIGIHMVAPLYKLIPKLYQIFYFLSNAKFLEEDTINSISKNLYVLVSVVMLFAFSATFLSAIVNPDVLSDKKKGAWAVIKRAFISIVLIVLIPIGFDYAYQLQGSLMKNATIEKLIIGFTSDSFEGNGGQVIAGSLISSTLYPAEDEIRVNAAIGNDYEEMITKDIEKIDTFADAEIINIAPADGTSEHKYALEFDGLVAIIAGAIACYILLLFAIDMAIRMFKLLLLELTAPVSVLAYISAGNDPLKRWAKEVGKTYLEVFTRIAAMGFYLLLISNLSNFIESPTFYGIATDSTYNSTITGFKWRLLLKVIIIIGMLIFVKQIPELINSAFGTKIKTKGGIGARLKEMALVGDVASKAWNTHKKTIGLAAGALATGPAGVAIGAGAFLTKRQFDKAWNDGVNGSKPLKDTTAGKTIRKTGSYIKGGRKGLDEYNKNDSEYQAKIKSQKYEREVVEEKKLKTTIREKLENSISSATVPGIVFKTDTDGSRVLDTKSISMTDASTVNYGKMVDSVSTFTNNQKTVLKEFNEKQNKHMVAKNDVTYFNEAKTILENARNAETDATSKAEINKIITNLSNGLYNARTLDAAMYAATSTSLDATQQAQINSLVSKISDSSTNIKKDIELQAALNNSQAAFDAASEKLDKTIENASTAENKTMLKEMKSNSKKLNKVNTGTL